MSLDAYAICPCGSGKKLKFCCCKDLVHELEKVTRAMAGDQRAAALDQIQKLVADKGPRPALLALQAESLMALENLDEAEKANARLIEAMPHSPVGQAIQAVLDAVKGNVESAVERLQEALENTDDGMLRIVYSAIVLVANALIEAGKLLAGRGHLLLHAGFGGEENSPAIETLVQLNMTPGLPVLFKQDFQFVECPAGVPWHGEFNAAMRSARRGAWLAACESLESLNQKVPDQPAIGRNIAILRGWLGQDDQAVAAWRKYAALPNVSQDDSIEAEAIAHLLAKPAEQDFVDVLKLTYQVTDTQRLMEMFQSDKRMDAMPFDVAELAEEGEPPPKGAFHLYDRTMPASLEAVKSAIDLPRLIGEAYVFGKQTDREARVELVLDRTDEFEQKKSEILQRLGSLIGKLEKEEVLERISRLRAETAPKWRFPRDIDATRLKQLMDEQRREAYLTRWPNVPMGVFDGRSAREAAGVPALRNRVSGAILNLELANEESAAQNGFDFNELRRDLGLPERGTTEFSGGNLYDISLIRMGRLDYSQLSDDDLIKAYGRLALNGYRTALYRCAEELVARPSLANRVDLAEIYRALVTVARDSDKALQFLDRGRRVTATRGESPATWYLLELQIRLSRYEGEECNRLVRLISSRFGNEPGVARQLYALLVRHGVINPDGTPAHGPVSAPQAAVPAAEPAAASAAGSLWTPDSPAPAPKQESKLWLPGRD